MKHLIRLLALTTMGSLIVGCGSSGSSYSMLSTGQSFKQAKVNSKIDMLWTIDNSSSMTPLQTNMTNNFNSFMSTFITKGYDFHLAVTSTEAYLAGSRWANNPAYSKFSDGVSTHTGVFDIVPGTSNLINTFVANASLGANGSGDERAFSSIKASLNDTQNTNFLRPDSFLAVIILSDEDDFSDPNRAEYSWTFRNGIADHSYSDPGLESVDSYVSYLDTLTGTTNAATRRYSVSAITVDTQTCLNSHSNQSPSAIIGQRYIQIANDTQGVIGSVCDTSYAAALAAIESRILELGTQFYLNAPPIETSIVVTVNNVTVPNDPDNGWTYNSAANSIMFHGTAIPEAGADINVAFDPAKLSF